MSRSHTAIQHSIVKKLPEAEIEKRFPQVGRIADVVYFPKKIIFEIQYSSISLSEVQKRNHDYNSLGFQVIWIMHDRHYNQKILKPAELYLRKNLSLYTSITPFGQGFFYDQLEFLHGNVRLYKSAPFQVDHLIPRNRPSLPRRFPKILKNRLPYYFVGDATHTLLAKGTGQKHYLLEKSWTHTPWIKRIISPLFHALLQKNALKGTFLESQNKESPLVKSKNKPPL